MITRVGESSSRAATTRRVASMPSSSGMRMSISTTSGFSRRGHVDRLHAVDGLADHVDVVLGVEDHPEAGADERLVVGDHDAHAHALASSGSRGAPAASAASPRLAAAAVPRPRTRRRAAGRRAGRRRSRARARACRRARGRRSRRAAAAAVAVVGDRQHAARRSPRAHAHLGVAAAVLERVGQRLLHDAVGGEVDAGRQLAPLAGHVQLDRQPGRAAALDQRAELVQRRLRRRARRPRRRRAARRAGGASPPAPRGRCARSAPRRRSRAAGRASRMRRAPPAWMTIVRDRVGDDVVHLARDPAALLGDRARRRRPRAARGRPARPRAARR